MPSRKFARRLDALEGLFEFSSATFRQLEIDASLLFAIDFALEELFTNMVKYGGSKAQILIEIDAIPGGAKVVMVDEDVDFFDVTNAPPVDTDLPLQERNPGRLGLHLIPKVVDTIEYRYFEPERRCRVSFTKTLSRPEQQEPANNPNNPAQES